MAHRDAYYKIVSDSPVEYQVALSIQERLATARTKGEIPDTLLLLSHSTVITKGAQFREQDRAILESVVMTDEELRKRGLQVYDVKRVGSITLHAPGQLVGYPILNLERLGIGSTREYLSLVEQTLIATLGHYGIAGHPALDRTHAAVWYGNGEKAKKIAAIGIESRKPVVLHGFALNVTTDLSLYRYINPCGQGEGKVTSMQEITEMPYSVADVANVFVKEFEKQFEVKLMPMPPELEKELLI